MVELDVPHRLGSVHTTAVVDEAGGYEGDDGIGEDRATRRPSSRDSSDSQPDCCWMRASKCRPSWTVDAWCVRLRECEESSQRRRPTPHHSIRQGRRLQGARVTEYLYCSHVARCPDLGDHGVTGIRIRHSKVNHES